MKAIASALILAASLLPANAFAVELDQADAKRRELMAPKAYVRNCKRYSKMTAIAVGANGDAYPVKVICRMPPIYPEECFEKAKRNEAVRLRFDVVPDGYTSNIRLVEATNQCHVQAAASSLMLWKFEATETGAAELETKVTFERHR